MGIDFIRMDKDYPCIRFHENIGEVMEFCRAISITAFSWEPGKLRYEITYEREIPEISGPPYRVPEKEILKVNFQDEDYIIRDDGRFEVLPSVLMETIHHDTNQFLFIPNPGGVDNYFKHLFEEVNEQNKIRGEESSPESSPS